MIKLKIKILWVIMIASSLYSFSTPSLISKKSDFQIICSKVENYKDDSTSIEVQLKKFNYKRYIDEPIGKLLEHLNLKYERIIFVQMHPLKLAFVSVVYSDDISLDIYTEKYTCLKRERSEDEDESIWTVEDLLKEKVSKIRVRRRNGESVKEFPKKPKLPIV